MKTKKKEVILLLFVIIIQTIIFVAMGISKSYIHMDEAYSLGLANYDKVEIQENENFYNNWHNKDYYEDYLVVQDKDIGKYDQVYENQKNDVHPPFYYLLLRIFMGFSINNFSMWPGIILNIIIYAFITIFMYLITKKIFKSKEKAIAVSFVSSITLASITNAIYIRMYALSTLNILITTFLHMKLLDKEEVDKKILIAIGISVLIGSLTHYYYLFYLAMLYIIFTINYIKDKKIKQLIFYTVTMVMAGITSLIIFPYSINHMFFGYRGQGVISNLKNPSIFLNNIKEYYKKIDYYCFSNMLKTLFIIIAVNTIYRLCEKKKTKNESNKYVKVIIFPTIFYFILVSLASPFIELRYILPITGCTFILIMYILHQTLGFSLNKKEKNTVFILILIIIVIVMPIWLNYQPEVLYLSNKEIVQKLEGELNVPTIYLFKSENNRFLDDIYLFSIIDESYIAKDIEYNNENIKQILEGKDISKGIVVFINEGQENDNILNIVKNAINGIECTHLKRLNACDVYYLK